MAKKKGKKRQAPSKKKPTKKRSVLEDLKLLAAALNEFIEREKTDVLVAGVQEVWEDGVEGEMMIELSSGQKLIIEPVHRVKGSVKVLSFQLQIA